MRVMHRIFRTLLVFVLLAAAGFAQKRDVIAEAEKFEQTMTKAKAGDSTAQYNLGNMYYNGEGVQTSYAEAVKWYRKAAEQGHAGAQSDLAHRYESLTRVRMSNDEEFMWLSKAAEQGHAGAQLSLGQMYQDGRGTPKDLVLAHVWMALAEKKGAFSARESILLMEPDMTFEQKLDAAKKERALNAEPQKPAVSSGGGGGGVDPSWVIGAVGIAWALVTLARRVSQR